VTSQSSCAASPLIRALASAVLVVSGFVACAPLPVESGSERLDENTGTTLTVMPRPVELVAERPRGANRDPFAYLAPFQTNRMGDHELFLWVSAPQDAGPLATPRVLCGEQAVALEPLQGTLGDIGLSGPPYEAPAPWSAQWYFRLTGEALDCFVSARELRIETQAADQQEPARYVADARALEPLTAFIASLRT